MKIIAIVGFGFCGRLALDHLVKRGAQKIIIFDKNGEDALGAAFSSFSPHYILNVPVEKMSAFSDCPQDFLQFLERKYPQILQEIGAKGFAPRKIYGEYLQEITRETLAQAQQKNIAIGFVSEDVMVIKKISEDSEDENFALITTSGNSYQANEIMLATSFAQSELSFNFVAKNFVKKLWSEDALQFHQQKFSDEKICLIGSGLTAVDLIVGLKKKDFRGKVFVVSRRGNFPQKHFVENPIKSAFIEVADAKKGVLFLCLKIRNFLRKNPQADLRHVIDSIRHITKELWQNFDARNKKLFLRFLPYWNIFRHRAPATSIAIIEEMLATKQLEIKKCGVKKIVEKDAKFLVETKNEEIVCDYVVNCLGFELRAQKYLLLKQMIAENLLQKNLLLVSENHPKIHLLGGLNIARDFECTAVPDLRVSVENVVKNLV